MVPLLLAYCIGAAVSLYNEDTHTGRFYLPAAHILYPAACTSRDVSPYDTTTRPRVSLVYTGIGFLVALHKVHTYSSCIHGYSPKLLQVLSFHSTWHLVSHNLHRTKMSSRLLILVAKDVLKTSQTGVKLDPNFAFLIRT